MIAAPAIVRASSIMPVQSFWTNDEIIADGYRRVGLFTREMLTRETIAILNSNNDAFSEINHEFGAGFMRIGSTLRIRKPNYFSIRTRPNNDGAIRVLDTSTSGDRDLLRVNRGDALNA